MIQMLTQTIMINKSFCLQTPFKIITTKMCVWGGINQACLLEIARD